MGIIDETSQKIKGNFQKIRGEVKTRNGDPVGGFIDKTKGAFNNTMADLKRNTRRRPARRRYDRDNLFPRI